MINEIIIEGQIVGEPWTYDNQTLFRLECVRDPHRAGKGTGTRGDGSDYVTVRLPAERFGGMPFTPDRSKMIRIHGFLQSREYTESLDVFLERAKGEVAMVSVTEDIARRIVHNRVTTEVIAERVVQFNRPQRDPQPPSASGRMKGPGPGAHKKSVPKTPDADPSAPM